MCWSSLHSLVHALWAVACGGATRRLLCAPCLAVTATHAAGSPLPAVLPASTSFLDYVSLQPGKLLTHWLPQPLLQAPHARFQREGNDLVCTLKVPLVTALTGGLPTIQTLDGRQLQVPLASTVTPNTTRTIPGEGALFDMAGLGSLATLAA